MPCPHRWHLAIFSSARRWKMPVMSIQKLGPFPLVEHSNASNEERIKFSKVSCTAAMSEGSSSVVVVEDSSFGNSSGVLRLVELLWSWISWKGKPNHVAHKLEISVTLPFFWLSVWLKIKGQMVKCQCQISLLKRIAFHKVSPNALESSHHINH